MDVGNNMNIRIESIEEKANTNYGILVRYSVWGKDSVSNVCSTMDAGGEFWTNLAGYQFREFTDSFIVLTEVDKKKVTLTKYTGKQAKKKCLELADWKKQIACNLYPDDDREYVENNTFRIYQTKGTPFYDTQFVLLALENCYNKMKQIFPNISYRHAKANRFQVYQSEGTWPSADYERISIPQYILNTYEYESKLIGIENLYPKIQDNSCPFSFDFIPHELTHLVFADTFLQRPYDGYLATEVTEKKSIPSLNEGFAEFVPYLIAKKQPDVVAKSYIDQRTKFCGKDALLDVDNMGIPDEQLLYKNILEGNGYLQSHYNMGFCFYKRVEDECGEEVLTGLINEEVLIAGSIRSYPSFFGKLANSCGKEKIQEIMTDYGFDVGLIDVHRQIPNTGFSSGQQVMGCTLSRS